MNGKNELLANIADKIQQKNAEKIIKESELGLAQKLAQTELKTFEAQRELKEPEARKFFEENIAPILEEISPDLAKVCTGWIQISDPINAIFPESSLRCFEYDNTKVIQDEIWSHTAYLNSANRSLEIRRTPVGGPKTFVEALRIVQFRIQGKTFDEIFSNSWLSPDVILELCRQFESGRVLEVILEKLNHSQN